MARFTLQAVPATFIKSAPGVVLCSVAMRAVPLIRREVKARTQGDAESIMAATVTELSQGRIPYSLTLRLADARAPRGFKAWPRSATRHDESFGKES